MHKILIVYHTQTGNTAKMAERVAGGVDSITGAEAVIKKAVDADLRHLLECDGLVIGSPEYFGYMSGMIKDFFDRTYEQARGRTEIFRKPYAAFISAGNDGSSALIQIERICIGYQFKKVHEPVIAVGDVTSEVLTKCEELGKTIALGCREGIY
ncbi:MAG TPA: flavodoxin [Desulfobacteraceae bacterium]|nr:flavodoxin [Desulfobacteraceae bacterium]